MFFLGLAIAFGLVALAGTWKPAARPGPPGRHQHPADAQGERQRPSPSTRPARSSTSGSTAPASPRPRSPPRATTYIVVEIPGDSQRDLVDTVKRQAQLRFRLVACSDADPSRCRPTPHATTRHARPTPGVGVTAAGVHRVRRTSPRRHQTAQALGHSNRPPALLGKHQTPKHTPSTKRPDVDRRRRAPEPSRLGLDRRRRRPRPSVRPRRRGVHRHAEPRGRYQSTTR